MKPYFTKRFFAYLIDIVIVFVLSTLITGFVPISQKATVISENIVDLTNRVSEEKISKEKYNYELQELNYHLTRETVIISLVNIAVYLLYFVVYPVYNNGQTIGKKTQGLKIVNKNSQVASMNNLLVRTLVLHGIAINIISLILILTINKDSFMLINNTLSYLNYLILVISLFAVILTKSGRGLHDVLSNTKVINEEDK